MIRKYERTAEGAAFITHLIPYNNFFPIGSGDTDLRFFAGPNAAFFTGNKQKSFEMDGLSRPVEFSIRKEDGSFDLFTMLGGWVFPDPVSFNCFQGIISVHPKRIENFVLSQPFFGDRKRVG